MMRISVIDKHMINDHPNVHAKNITVKQSYLVLLLLIKLLVYSLTQCIFCSRNLCQSRLWS